MRKVTESKKPLSLEELAGSFLAMKKAQKLGQETLYGYEKQIERFLRSSHNSLDYAILEQDTLNFFAAIPDTSPARYNKPYQYITAWFNWMVKQKYLPQNPISANELKKRRDDGNIKPATVEDLKRFMGSLDKRSYGEEIATRLFNYGTQFTFNYFELRGSAAKLADGWSLEDIADYTLENGCSATSEEQEEFANALRIFQASEQKLPGMRMK